jgi:PAS domain S-box-containing protein
LYRDLRSVFAAIHPDDHTRAVTAIEAGREQGFEVEYRVVRPDGSIRWIRDRGFPIRDEAGRCYRLAGIAEDITERKQAEDALRRSEDHLRLVIDTIPTMAWSIRPDGVLDYVNQRWLDYTGLSFEEAIEEPTRTVHPEDVSRATEKWLVVKATNEAYADEMRLRRADGEYRWFLIRIAPLLDERGNLLKRYGVAINIEDRKQAEEKLKHSKTQLAEAQRLAHIGSWDWDLRTNAVTWSDELYQVFGLQPGTISDAGDVDRFIHPDDLDLGWDTVKRAVANKEPYDYYHRILRPDGTERIARSRGSIMSDERGEPIKVFGATQDVTDLKRAEQKLKATSDQLRALSARLQFAREEEGIRIAREIHDELGSSLTRLKWDLEIMGKEQLAAQDQERLEKSSRKISEMISLVDETVDTVRRISAELRPSALDDLGLGAALRLQAHQFQDRMGIIVECDCSAESVKLTRQQSTAVFRICEEALTNVMRHSHATRVKVRLKIDQDDLVLTIRDNGLGITPLEMSDSLSLGLLGMRERAHLIGGEIEIEGIEDKGTVVTARVPISRGS